MADRLQQFFDSPSQSSSYGGLQPNSAIPNPTFLSNDNTTVWVNNRNWEGSITNEVLTQLSLEMLRQTEFDHLRFVSGPAIIAPRNAGTARISYNRLRPLSVIITPLREGEIPPKITGGSEKASATYTQFGGVMEITNVESEQNPDELFLRYSQDMVRSASETLDIICREVMYMGASRAFANGCINVDEVAAKGVSFKSPTVGQDMWKYREQRGAQLTYSDIREQQKLMKLFKVKPHPRNGAYIVLVGAEGIDQLRHDKEFQDWNQATDPTMFNSNRTVLTATDIHVYEIENAKKVKTSDKQTEVGVAFILGADCYREVNLAGAGIKIIYKEFGSAGTMDALNQVSSIGWIHHGYGVAMIRSEAAIALHYAIDSNVSKTFGTTIAWATDDKGHIQGDIKYNSPYGFTKLSDGANFFLDLSSIYDGSVVDPKPYPTDQGTYVDNLPNSDKPNPSAMSKYWTPALQEVLGTLANLVPELKQTLANAGVPLNVTNALNATYTENSVVELNTVLTVTALGEIGSGKNIQPTDNQIKAAILDKNSKVNIDYINLTSQTKVGANAVGNALYKGTVAVTFTTKKDALSTVITTTALGTFSGVGDTPTSDELEAVVATKNTKYNMGDATFGSLTASSATATASTTGGYKGTVALTYTYTKK